MSDSFKDLKEKLDNHHNWPENYTFKFIVPKEQILELTSILPKGKLSQRESKTGKYISVSLVLKINHSDEVIDVYKKATKIKNLISL